MKDQYLLWVERKDGAEWDSKAYPYCIPAVAELIRRDRIELSPSVTFLVGENGSGKSTLMEAIAVAVRLKPEGGSWHFNFSTHATHSELHEMLRVARGTRRPQDSFFLRSESFYNVASQIEDLGIWLDNYGGIAPHKRSHGEAFFSLLMHRFRGNGLYLLDEPESALSPARQLACLSRIHDLVTRRRSQFLIATHSPILMAYPDALIYHLGADGIRPIAYEETEHFQLSRTFFQDREPLLRELFEDGD